MAADHAREGRKEEGREEERKETFNGAGDDEAMRMGSNFGPTGFDYI